MLVSKCDICKKEVEKSLYVGVGTPFPGKYFCYNCASPMVEFLKKHKFIKEEKKHGSTKGK